MNQITSPMSGSGATDSVVLYVPSVSVTKASSHKNRSYQKKTTLLPWLQALEDFKLWRTSSFGGLQALEEFKLWRTPSRLSASAQINGCIVIAVVVLGYMTGSSQHDSSWLLIFITQHGIIKITKIWLGTGRILNSSIFGRECHLERLSKSSLEAVSYYLILQPLCMLED